MIAMITTDITTHAHRNLHDECQGSYMQGCFYSGKPACCQKQRLGATWPCSAPSHIPLPRTRTQHRWPSPGRGPSSRRCSASLPAKGPQWQMTVSPKSGRRQALPSEHSSRALLLTKKYVYSISHVACQISPVCGCICDKACFG